MIAESTYAIYFHIERVEKLISFVRFSLIASANIIMKKFIMTYDYMMEFNKITFQLVNRLRLLDNR